MGWIRCCYCGMDWVLLMWDGLCVRFVGWIRYLGVATVGWIRCCYCEMD